MPSLALTGAVLRARELSPGMTVLREGTRIDVKSPKEVYNRGKLLSANRFRL